MIVVNIDYDRVDRSSEIEYVFKQLFCFSGSPVKLRFNQYVENNSQINIEYRNTQNLDLDYQLRIPEKIIFIDCLTFDRFNSLKLHANSFSYNGGNVYSTEIENRPDTLEFLSSQNLAFDVIDTIFFHLSRIEEYFADEASLDHHTRMKSSEQFLVKNRLNLIPIVDSLRVSIFDILKIKHNFKTTHIMSHDIDSVRKFPSFYRTIRAFARVLIREKSWTKFIATLKLFLKYITTRKDPFNTFDFLFKNNSASQKFVFFMSGGITRYDNMYDIRDKIAKDAIRLAEQYGYIVGLHPSYAAASDVGQFSDEMQTIRSVLGKKVTHSRQHILHYFPDHTHEVIEKNKIILDSTLGYQDIIGFRCGTGCKFQLFNLNTRQATSVFEQPLVVMDGPLCMMNDNDADKAWKFLQKFLLDLPLGTCVTYNFHNTIFSDVNYEKNKMKELYINLNQKIKLLESDT